MNIYAVKPPKKIALRQVELRQRLFPHITEGHLWNRKTHHGFTTIPRTLPLIMSILDDLAGMPVGQAYLELWCRSFDEAFVTLSKPREVAFHSGIKGERQESTWRTKIKKLHELGFIEVASGPAGAYSYALILNPYLVLRRLFTAGGSHIPVDKYNALLDRAIEITAQDMDMPDPWAPAPVLQVAAEEPVTAKAAFAAAAVPPMPTPVPAPPETLQPVWPMPTPTAPAPVLPTVVQEDGKP